MTNKIRPQLFVQEKLDCRSPVGTVNFMAINMRICYLPYDHLVHLQVSNLHNYNSGNMQFLPHVDYCNSDLLVSAEDCNLAVIFQFKQNHLICSLVLSFFVTPTPWCLFFICIWWVFIFEMKLLLLFSMVKKTN